MTLVRASGMRLVGPNCMGILNTDPAIALNATFTTPVLPPAGNIGMLSQSGALGLAMLDYVQTLHVGLSTFVSIGNRADVSSNDILAYWADDPRTSVMVLYLESFGNPRQFARLAPAVAQRKPIIAVKSGRSVAGSRAAASHSAALATSDTAVEALFEQAGVMRANTLQELFDVAVLLSTQPMPPGPRVGVVTNAGGPGILLADMGETHGLVLPELTPETQAALRTILPPQAGVANPVDMIAAATPAQYARTIELVGADATIDALVVIYIPPLVTDPVEIAQAIAQGVGDSASAETGADGVYDLAGHPCRAQHGATWHVTDLHLSGERGPGLECGGTLRALADTAAWHAAAPLALCPQRGPGRDRSRAGQCLGVGVVTTRGPGNGAGSCRHHPGSGGTDHPSRGGRDR